MFKPFFKITIYKYFCTYICSQTPNFFSSTFYR